MGFENIWNICYRQQMNRNIRTTLTRVSIVLLVSIQLPPAPADERKPLVRDLDLLDKNSPNRPSRKFILRLSRAPSACLIRDNIVNSWFI